MAMAVIMAVRAAFTRLLPSRMVANSWSVFPSNFRTVEPHDALGGQVAHSVAVDRHQAGLGHREKSRYQQEQQKG